MNEHVTDGMLEKWFAEYNRAKVCSAAGIGGLRIEVDKGMIGLKNPKTGLLQILNPNDFKIGKLSPRAEILVCKSELGDHFVYVLNPGSEKVVLLEVLLEKAAFGVYSQDYPLGFRLSESFCASAIGKNLLVVDMKENQYVFINETGEKLHAGINAEKGTVCTVLDNETVAVCTPLVLFVVKKGKRVGIDIKKALGKKMKKPEFGAGESETQTWLAVRDSGQKEAILVSLTDKDLGYAVHRPNELKGKEIIE